MQWDAIRRPVRPYEPNLGDYESTRRAFSWSAARRKLSGLPRQGGLNVAYEAVDKRAVGPMRYKTALRCRARNGTVTELGYNDLRIVTNQFANLLRYLDVGRTERVCTLLDRVPELYITALGTVKNTSVYCPLLPTLGPAEACERLRLADVRVLVTTPELYKRLVGPFRDELPALEHILTLNVDEDAPADTIDLAVALSSMQESFEIPPTDPQDMALVHFTSGTTGKPKGAVHVHESVVAFHSTSAYGLDLHPEDVFWCTADPGWGIGTAYGIIAPLTHGATVVADAGDLDPRYWCQLLAEQRVTVWYTTASALRTMMRAGTALPRLFDLSALRFIASVGEPLSPELMAWASQAFGLRIHENWWQSETGGIMISNYAGMEVRTGSMGRPVPGIEAALLERGADGRAAAVDGAVTVLDQPNVVGELALRPGWPSMFRGYLHDAESYEKRFVAGWYVTGELARRDADGYYWYVGRVEDVIEAAGQLVGPYDVEAVLMTHPAVSEAGVIGKPDGASGQLVKAFVALRPNYLASDALRLELLAFGRTRLGVIAPSDLGFEPRMPHTPSGKVRRRLLKARELGLSDDDASTLEPS